MSHPAFATSFTGLSLSNAFSRNACSAFASPSASMGDSIAPVIKIKDTKWDGTSSVAVSMEKIATSEAAAVGIAGNSALGATLRRRSPAASAPDNAASVVPPGTAPKDFYFPSSTRNEAPVIEISPNSISVGYEKINPTIGGVAANSSDSVAFWKETPFKYTAPDAPEVVDGAEVISTAAFEMYFPTKIRNRAPEISIKRPVSDEDPTGGFIEVGSALIGLNVDLAREVSVSSKDDIPAAAGSAVVAKYFPADRMGKAPVVAIEPNTSVVVGMEEVAAPEGIAAEIAAQYSSSDAIVDKVYPPDTRYIAPEIKLDGSAGGSEEDMSVSVAMAYVDEPSTEGVGYF